MAMPLQIEERSITDPEWDALVESLPGATLFHTSLWLHLLERNYRTRWRRWLFLDDGRPVGLFPLLEGRKGPFRLGSSPLSGLATPYLGPLIDDTLASEAAELVDQTLRRQRYDYAELTSVGTGLAAAYSQLGFEAELLHTYELDLSPGAAALWQQLDCRTHVRKALKNGVSVVEAPLPTWLEAYWAMAIDTYQHQGRLPPIPKSVMGDVWQTFHPSGRVRLWLALHEGAPIAGAIVLSFKGRSYYWDAVAFRDKLSLRPANLLMWRTIEAAAEAGQTTYDLVGANITGIAKFKSSFGGTLTDYLYVYRPYSALAKVGRSAYQKGMPVLRRAGLWLAGLKLLTGGE